ncbi:MAG: hypothetical protein PF636_07075 [Actinomycetota bacterium]|jgi:hypothetical protein|nr:hypothetical protein [Actinomycetota bacterium]
MIFLQRTNVRMHRCRTGGRTWLLATVILMLLVAGATGCAAEDPVEPETRTDVSVDPKADEPVEPVWQEQVSGVTDRLYDVGFVDPDVGWAVGGDKRDFGIPEGVGK